jgi:hypothetical protein
MVALIGIIDLPVRLPVLRAVKYRDDRRPGLRIARGGDRTAIPNDGGWSPKISAA